MLRIAIVTSYFYPHIGGIATQLSALAPRLRDAGADVHVIAPDFGSAEPYGGKGVTVHRLHLHGQRAASSSIFVAETAAILAKLRPKVIHAHELLLPATASLLGKPLCGAKLVVSVHTAGPELGEIARLQRARFGAKRLAVLRSQVDRFVAVSSAIDAEMAAAGIPGEHRVIIPNGIDLERFQPPTPGAQATLRADLGLPPGVIALYTGRLSSEKRLDLLIKLWPGVRAVYPTASLVIVGGGPDSDALQKIAGEGVIFTGPVRNVVPYLQAADLFVLASASEGFSVSILEAMASGLPVVATRVGGIPDLVVDGATGLLTPVDQPVMFADAVMALLGNPEKSRDFGHEGRKRAESVFAMDSVAARLAELYADVAAHSATHLAVDSK